MSRLTGINLSGTIVPNDNRDRYGTHDAQYGIGGFRAVPIVNDLTDPNSANFIWLERRSVGMRVKVYADPNPDNNTDWTWTGSEWIKDPVAQQAILGASSAWAGATAAQLAADAATLNAGIFPDTTTGIASTTSGDYFSTPGSIDQTYLDLWLNDGGSAVFQKSYPSTEIISKLTHPTARTFYVTMDGNNNNDGTNLKFPLQTINRAFELIEAIHATEPGLEKTSHIVIVHPGTYVVQPDTVVPRNCALYGYDLRVTNLKLPDGDEENNMFQMSSGIKVRGFTFLGLRQNRPEDDIFPPSLYTSTAAAIADTDLKDGDYFYVDPAPPYGDKVKYVLNLDSDGNRVANVADFDMPPTKGWAFVFKPNEYITRSPYIADCSQLHNFTYQQMTLPIDRLKGNPGMPRSGGNIWAQGSVLNDNSPLKSVVVDSFTAINPNGFGYLISHGAFVQLVSVFTNWSRVGIWSDTGGQVTIANSNNTFGDYALLSTGYRYAIEIPENDPDPDWLIDEDGIYNPDTTIVDPSLTLPTTLSVIDASSYSLTSFAGSSANVSLYNPAVENPYSVISVGATGFPNKLQNDETLVYNDGEFYDLTSDALDLIDAMWTDLQGSVNAIDPSYEEATKRDADAFLRALQSDIRSGTDRAISFFAENLFDWQGNSYFSTTEIISAVIYTWEYMRDELTGVLYASQTTIHSLIESCVQKAIDVVNTPGSFTVSKSDNLTDTAHQIIDDMWTSLYNDISYQTAIEGSRRYVLSQLKNYQYLTKRDAETLIRAIQDDIQSGTGDATRFFIKNLYDWEGNLYFSSQVLDSVNFCWDTLETSLSGVTYSANPGTQASIVTLIGELFQMIRDVVADPASYTTTVPNTNIDLTETARTLVDDMWEDLYGSDAYNTAIDEYDEEDLIRFEALTRRDAVTFLRAIQNDVNSGQDRGINFFVKGLFNWTGISYLSDQVIDAVVHTWEFMRDQLIALYGSGEISDLITANINKAIDVVQHPQNYRVTYPSTVEATGQQLSYAGCGVNYNSLPYNQRGTGLAPNPRETIVKKNGGKIFATYATQAGDTYLGDDLRVDFERNTIEGQAFSRGVQNITLPLIIGIGG